MECVKMIDNKTNNIFIIDKLLSWIQEDEILQEVHFTDIVENKSYYIFLEKFGDWQQQLANIIFVISINEILEEEETIEEYIERIQKQEARNPRFFEVITKE